MSAKKKFKKNPSAPSKKEKFILPSNQPPAKNGWNNLSYIVSIVLFFFVGTGVLVYSPRVANLAESKLIFASNTITEGQKPIIQEVKGAEIKPVITIEDQGTPPPKFTGMAVLAEDLNTGQILFQKNIDQKLSPASTTKIMTALVAAEHYQPGDVLTVLAEDKVSGSSMDVVVGEKLTFRGLLYGMMLNSGNDAAFTIASNYPGGLSAFVQAMNNKAKEMGLTSSNFRNPAGFDDQNHYSSASDMAKIAKAAAQNSQISKVVSTKETTVVSVDLAHSHKLVNLNKLLNEDGVIGIKTGYTEIAGENLVGLVERDNHKILTVVLNSQDRFGESKNLINWIYSNFVWKNQ